MRQRGYSLVEVVVVIGIMSILLSIGTLRFNDYLRRSRSEAQTRMIYAELLSARSKALYERRSVRVKLYQSKFEVYSTKTDSAGGAAPVLSQQLAFSVVQNQSGNNIDFDEQGITNNDRSVCLEDEAASAGVDSIVIAATRVAIGKKTSGQECNSENISKR